MRPEWDRLRARWLERFAPSGDELARRRVDDTYAPVLEFCVELLAATSRRPIVVGLSAPQGAGKSTLAEHVVEALGAFGHPTCAISIDDFYLTHVEQCALAAAHSGKPYLDHRGYPGTHDVELGAAVLRALRDATGPVAIPRYDKSAHGGRGDRAPRDRWSNAPRPLDLVVLEGWMLGFVPVPPESVPEPELQAPNTALAKYASWHAELDAFVHCDLADALDVVHFRVDAERARRAAGAPGLSDDEARDYVTRFLPAYRLWVTGLRAAPPVQGPALRLVIRSDRLALRG
jgi:D-glycerate 3-kinase